MRKMLCVCVKLIWYVILARARENLNTTTESRLLWEMNISNTTSSPIPLLSIIQPLAPKRSFAWSC
ncbi:hypothetical protein PHET_12377 [Paragonimus heterotremus]|uniref:Secreted protein n=1 Tax=Paragonimus heterotremus TaxID=100268 RepID=A0A8J4SEI9_9TREM|nr:hypothetical protein PHET_12377 [Paragonimus heterotremus]